MKRRLRGYQKKKKGKKDMKKCFKSDTTFKTLRILNKRATSFKAIDNEFYPYTNGRNIFELFLKV